MNGYIDVMYTLARIYDIGTAFTEEARARVAADAAAGIVDPRTAYRAAVRLAGRRYSPLGRVRLVAVVPDTDPPGLGRLLAAVFGKVAA